MTRLLFALLLVAVASPVWAEGYTPLTNGKNLDGWVGDPDLWSIHEGVITGSTDRKKLKKNSFLATTKSYKNFRFRGEFKLRNHNSGIQYRSKLHPDFVVTGYQADIADNQFNGILYEEGGRGILVHVKPEEVAKHFKKDGWNKYEITAKGGHLTHKLNGFTTVDYQEKPGEGATSGVIALQLHTGPDQPPAMRDKMQVQFRNLEIEELP